MDDRRRYPRVNAPIFCRPVGRSEGHTLIDVSLGGMRLWLDDPIEPGDQLELDLTLPEGPPLFCTAEVVWVIAAADGAPARHDVGVRFVRIREGDKARLAKLLAQE
jgi:c-di-GMP-binding flagellar brake protein YcgR